MKQAIILCVLTSLVSLKLNAQQLSGRDSMQFNKLLDEFIEKEATYNCNQVKGRTRSLTKMVSSTTFDSLFRPIFSKVVLNNKDLVANGSAYALSFNKEQATFSVSYNKEAKHKKSFWNWGFQASTTDKFLKLFAKDEWQRGMGLSIGQTIPYKRKIVNTEKECRALQSKRIAMTSFWLASIKSLLVTDTADLWARVNKTNSGDYRLPSQEAIHQLIRELPFQSETHYQAAKDKLDSIKMLRNLIATNKGIDTLVEKYFSKFEQQNFRNFGYNITWFNWRIIPEYKGVNIYDTTAGKLAGIQRKDFYRLGIEGTVNFMFNRPNHLFFFTGGMMLKNTNYLEGKDATEISFLLADIDGTSTVLRKNVEATVTSNYEKFKQQFLLLTPSAGINYFFGKNRTIGLDLMASTKLKVMAPTDIDFQNLFTVRAGILFSFKGKSDLANSTVGMIATWEDMTYKKPTIRDNFTLGLRLGIPFSY